MMFLVRVHIKGGKFAETISPHNMTEQMKKTLSNCGLIIFDDVVSGGSVIIPASEVSFIEIKPIKEGDPHVQVQA